MHAVAIVLAACVGTSSKPCWPFRARRGNYRLRLEAEAVVRSAVAPTIALDEKQEPQASSHESPLTPGATNLIPRLPQHGIPRGPVRQHPLTVRDEVPLRLCAVALLAQLLWPLAFDLSRAKADTGKSPPQRGQWAISAGSELTVGEMLTGAGSRVAFIRDCPPSPP